MTRSIWLLLILILLTGCRAFAPQASPSKSAPVLDVSKMLVPSHNRDWSPDLAVLPYVGINGNHVFIKNIRNCTYHSDEDYVVKHYDKQFDLNELERVDFVVVPFKDAPSLAHTMLSFGFTDGQFLIVSVEARLEKGEKYSPLLGELRQYELMYVLADERDAILRRTQHRDVDVYVYRTIATPAQARELFIDVLRRVNQIAETPEFYDTLSNNCTSNIVHHLNRLRPGRVPYDVRVLLPGFSDELAYELGLLSTNLPFAEARRQARVTEAANRYADATDFSSKIRR